MTNQDAIRFEHYQLERNSDQSASEIGRGRIDKTFKVRDIFLERTVALRVIQEEFLSDRGLRAQFMDEARGAARLRHSNIAQILSIGDSDAHCFCAMEYPEGETLEALARRLGSLDASTVLKIGDQIAKALRETWQHGFALLELTPSNVVVTYEGDEMLVKVTNLRPVKPTAELDIRSNIHSLGLIMCRLLDNAGDPSNLDHLRGLPRKVLVLLEQMLESDPARRIQSPFDLRAAIAHCFETEDVRHAWSPSPLEMMVLPDTLAERFNLMNPVENGDGAFYEAEDLVRGGKVIVHIFSMNESSADVTLATDVAKSLLASPHDFLVRPVEVSPESRRAFVAYEMVQGISLLELLRKRRKLPLAELLLLLDQLGPAADHAISHQLAGIDFGLRSIRICLGNQDLPEDPGASLRTWPAFLIKVSVPGSFPAPGGVLMTRPLPAEQPREDLRTLYIRALGGLSHELLGGMRSRTAPFDEHSCVPLSSLSEAGNVALRRALFAGGDQAFSTAAEFVAALRKTIEFEDLAPFGN